jgi:hypothetical protein
MHRTLMLGQADMASQKRRAISRSIFERGAMSRMTFLCFLMEYYEDVNLKKKISST